MGVVKDINDEAHFHEEISASTGKLVVVEFTAIWCGPCKRLAPIYEGLAHKYHAATFLKVDADKLQDFVADSKVSIMPTFHFYKNGVKVDSLLGGDRVELEAKIKKYYEGEVREDAGVSRSTDAARPPAPAPAPEPPSPVQRLDHKSDGELDQPDDPPSQPRLTTTDPYLESDCQYFYCK